MPDYTARPDSVGQAPMTAPEPVLPALSKASPHHKGEGGRAVSMKVTQADRDLIVTLMRPLAKSAIEHKAIDFIAEGRGDDAEAVQLVAKYRLAYSLLSQADATSGEEMRLREENARLRAHIAASANSINAAGSAYDEAIAALDRLVAETKSSARAALTKGADRHD